MYIVNAVRRRRANITVSGSIINFTFQRTTVPVNSQAILSWKGMTGQEQESAARKKKKGQEELGSNAVWTERTKTRQKSVRPLAANPAAVFWGQILRTISLNTRRGRPR